MINYDEFSNDSPMLDSLGCDAKESNTNEITADTRVSQSALSIPPITGDHNMIRDDSILPETQTLEPQAETRINGDSGNEGDAPPVVVVAAPDPFDPENLRIAPGSSGDAIRKVITTVPCKKPGKQEFVRVRSGDEWRLDTLLLEDQESREYFVVAPELRESLVQDTFTARLVTTITRNGDLFLWLLKLPGPDGRSNRWNDSALAASELAEENWVRCVSDMSAGCYDVHVADGIKIEPDWPELEFKEILRLCFQDRFIDSFDHPFLKRLRGEV